MKRREILQKINIERARQDAKWGYPQKNTLPEWGIILGEEVGEAMKELNELHFRRRSHPSTSLGYLINELIQTAAVAVSIVEHLTEYGIAVDDRHPVVFEDRFDTDADQIPEDDETVDEVVSEPSGSPMYICRQTCPECEGYQCKTCDPSTAFENYVDGCPVGNIPIWKDVQTQVDVEQVKVHPAVIKSMDPIAKVHCLRVYAAEARPELWKEFERWEDELRDILPVTKKEVPQP